MKKVKIELELKPETIQEIEQWLNFYEVSSRVTDYDLPKTTQDFIKMSLYRRLKTLDKLSTLNSNEGKLFNRFKIIMKKKGMKQSELSKIAKIDQGNLSHILNNRTQPMLEVFLRLWVALDCPPIEEVLYRE